MIRKSEAASTCGDTGCFEHLSPCLFSQLLPSLSCPNTPQVASHVHGKVHEGGAHPTWTGHWDEARFPARLAGATLRVRMVYDELS